MALIPIDVKKAVADGKEFVEALVPVTSGSFGLRLNQNIVGIAIAPSSDYGEALIRLPVAEGGSAADYMSLTAGTPFLGDTAGILQASPTAGTPDDPVFDIVGVIQQTIDPAQLVNTRDGAPAASYFGVILYLRPPRQLPNQRAEYTNINVITELTTPLGAGVGDVVVCRVPAVGRKLWHVIMQFTTPGNIASVAIKGGVFRNGNLLLEKTEETQSVDAEGFVEFVIPNRPAWHTMAIVVSKTNASVYRLIYRLEDDGAGENSFTPSPV